jgi:hypothetical protein
MDTVLVLEQIEVGGATYGPGQVVSMESAEAAPLIAAAQVELAAGETVFVVHMPRE